MEPDLRMTLSRLARRIRRERPHAEISDSQVSALFVIAKHAPLTIGDLSAHERISAPSMNRTVNLLVDGGYVQRDSSPDDGRKVIVNLTPAGEALIAEIREHRQAWFDARLAKLSDEERAALDAATPVLRRLAEDDAW